ncbi:hypothetical protein D0Z03_001752 [Geotrichum reessii]|nr:hypothetical protein D0Z03_001752 [Galactomyces reessii]
MFPYSYYAPNNLYYTPRRVEKPEPVEDPSWSLERIAALRAAELQRKEQQKAELKQQYEQRLAQIDEYHNQQELELKRYEEHIKKLQEQKRLQEKRLLEQQKQKAEARKRNEELINSLFKSYESKKEPVDTESRLNDSSNPPSSPFELLLSLLNGTDLNGSPGKPSETKPQPVPTTTTATKPEVENKSPAQDPEQVAGTIDTTSELLDDTTPASAASETETTETISEPKKEPEVNFPEVLQSINNKIEKNIETYNRINTNTIDGNEEDGEPYSSLSTSSDSQSSSITLRSRLKVLQRSQLELENIYQQLDTLGTPTEKNEKRLKHVLTGRAVTYADKLEELRHRIQKDLTKLNQEEKKQHTQKTEIPQPVEPPSTPAEPAEETSQHTEVTEPKEKLLPTAVTEPAEVDENNSATSEPVIEKSKPAPKPVSGEKSRVRRIEIQDLSDDEDF